MEALQAELEKIDIRFGQFAKQLYDKYVISVAALKTFTSKELQEDFGLPPGAAASISSSPSSSGESLLCRQLDYIYHQGVPLLHDSWLSQTDQ